MLISKVPDSEGGQGGEGQGAPEEDDHSNEYQTANELFELMAKNQNFDTTNVDTLTTRDLVLIYKNIDLGTKLMTTANELKLRRPNQYVEDVVYNEEQESDGSDVSDIYSNDDIHNMFLINKERIDLLNTPPSLENTLCHKFGDLDIQNSDVTTEYDKHFLFKDPYLKEQLKSLRLATETEPSVLPASLLDYICCKRLEDNYNFYMDNIIRYVKHTIEQLKRISNGDYLTDKAKEKWREVESVTDDPHNLNTKVLATTTSIPLHVERKVGGRTSTWDDIVHSAVDIRSLSKILEKKIVVEVPKLICGSYKLLSKRCADNLIISCKKDNHPIDDGEGESRVDVVFKLLRSETGEVMSNISSIMILQTTAITSCDAKIPLILPFRPLTIENTRKEESFKIVELGHDEYKTESIENNNDLGTNLEIIREVLPDAEPAVNDSNPDDVADNYDYGSYSDTEGSESIKQSSSQDSSVSNDALRSILEQKAISTQRESVCDVVYPDDLRLTLQKLTIQTALPEESAEDISQNAGAKKKSTSRIKSPYENQSLVMEEKKRRKLLEIRERRERKKMALAENCKITKHKYGKGAIMPQSSSSVTKLSISNKSFYNSIYGQTSNSDTKQAKGKRNRGKRELLDNTTDDYNVQHEASILTTEKNKQKYINRSYYLDDAVTEMMYMNMKGNENDARELCSTSTSVMSNEFHNNLKLLSQLIGPSDTEVNVADNGDSVNGKPAPLLLSRDNETDANLIGTSRSTLNVIPLNSPLTEDRNKSDPKKVTSTLECRKSIDKIYNLMKKIENAQDSESKSSKGKEKKEHANGGRDSDTICQGSESGTSLKHRLTSSNPSWFSFEKTNTDSSKHNNCIPNPQNAVPKVIISAKSSSVTPKSIPDKNKKDDRRKRSLTSPSIKIPVNPLRAISQLLHDFDHVQKTKHKPTSEAKSSKKAETVSDVKSTSRQSSTKRRSRLDQHNDGQAEKFLKLTSTKEKKKGHHSTDHSKSHMDEKHADKPRKKISDIIDEAKEARGEAVRGPSRLNSRLNALSQPKRSYVQAHSEEFQNKYGKNVMADRLQRLAAAPPPSLPERKSESASSRYKKRSGTEAGSIVSGKIPASSMPPLERERVRTHHTTSSPEVKDKYGYGVGPSNKQIIVPETPEIIKKKMVAVESYVKNHYGRATSSSSEHQQSVQKARVPLVPTDYELEDSESSSPLYEESTQLGRRLHNIINTILTSNSQALEVLTECHESNSKLSKESIVEGSVKSERMSTESEYPIDVLDDNNILTTVEKIDNVRKEENRNATNADIYKSHETQSNTEIEKLENALCRRISVGNFPKKLRIKNLTLTPKHSLQQVFVLQSGDAASLVVHNETKTDKYSELSTMPVLSKTQLDWRFSNFPMQIQTVGYAFPEYNTLQRAPHSPIRIFRDESSTEETSRYPSPDTCSHCYRDNQYFERVVYPQSSSEKGAQVSTESSALVSIGIGSATITEPQTKNVVKHSNATNTDADNFFPVIKPCDPAKDYYNSGHTQTSVTETKQTEAIDTEFVTVTPIEDIEDMEARLIESTIDHTLVDAAKGCMQTKFTEIAKEHTIVDTAKGCMQNKFTEIAKEHTIVDAANGCMQNKFTKIAKKHSLVDAAKGCKQTKFTEISKKHPLVDAAKGCMQTKFTEIAKDLMQAKLVDVAKENIQIKLNKETKEDTRAKVIETPQEDSQTKVKNIGKEKMSSEIIEQQIDSILGIKSATGPECSTSLDILVGLLSEIQKITTCQTKITNSDENEIQIQDTQELEAILNKASALEKSLAGNPREVLSFTSLEKLRQLESNPSLYSFYISDTDITDKDSPIRYNSEFLPVNTTFLFPNPKPICADKEVGPDTMEKEYVNTFTDVPSEIFPVRLNQSTNVSNSLVRVISEPSLTSVISYSEYHSAIFSSTSMSNSNNFDIPQIIITREASACNINKLQEKPLAKTSYKEVCQTFTRSKVKKSVKVSKKYNLKTEFDSCLKMKRDILVTFYSILVFTVFAALTFPSEMSYHV